MTPPRWSERLLRVFLRDRDRETVSGDLLEEYRESAVPRLGEKAAGRWYRRQVAALVWREVRLPLLVGVTVGSIMGLANLIDTFRRPLSDDTPAMLIAAMASVLVVWAAVAMVATWRTRRLDQAMWCGAIQGIATFAMFHLAAIARLNLFLGAIQSREDWQGLLARFSDSGFHSLRAFANYEYVLIAPLVIAIGALVGWIAGLAGGLAHTVRPRPAN